MNNNELESLIRSVVERLVDDSAPGSATPKAIAFGADHGGFQLKESLKEHAGTLGFQIKDCGTFSTDAVDYPDFAVKVAQAVATGQCRYGVMVDGAGIGSCMAANKIPGARAALCYDISTANNAREHNNANVLTLGAGLIGPALAKAILKTFVTTECTESRHQRRVDKIDELLPVGTRSEGFR